MKSSAKVQGCLDLDGWDISKGRGIGVAGKLLVFYDLGMLVYCMSKLVDTKSMYIFMPNFRVETQGKDGQVPKASA